MEGYIKSILIWLQRALCPARCVSCGQYDTWLCQRCLIKTRFISQLTCPVCGLYSAGGSICTQHKKIYLNGLWYALPYGLKTARQLIHLLKYDGVISIKNILAEFLFTTLKNYQLPPAWHLVPPDKWQLVPVPLFPRRQRERGFNQAELLADILSTKTGLKTNHVLIKRRTTKPQAQLPTNQRRQNISRSFAIKNNQNLSGQIFILIDDVYTSGSTLNTCAKVLKQAGALEVWALTVAKG